MDFSEQTSRQIERALRKVSSKFPADAECRPLTDLYIQVKQESGELLVFDDNDNELTRCVVEAWIGNSEESFYDELPAALSAQLRSLSDVCDNIAVLRPYSFVLIGEDKETIADLYLVDDDTIVLSGDLMDGLDEDLDSFWEELSHKA